MSEPRPVLVVGASGLMGAYLARVFGERRAVGTAHEQSGGDLVALDMRDRRPASSSRSCRPRRDLPGRRLERRALRAGAGRHARGQRGRHAGTGRRRRARRARPSCSSPPNTCSTARRAVRRGGRDEPDQRVRAAEGWRSSRRCPATGGDYLGRARVSCVYGHERGARTSSTSSGRRSHRGPRVPHARGPDRDADRRGQCGGRVRDLVRAGERGVFHVAGAERMLRSDFARIAAEELGLDPALDPSPTPTQELGLAAPRPRGAGLLVDKPRRPCARR